MDWFYPHEVEPDLEGGHYYEEAQANRDRRRRYSDFASDIAWRATKAATRHVLTKAFNKLKDKMKGKRAHDRDLDAAKKKARNASGEAKGRSANDSGIKPAMFLSGRGKEIPLVLANFQKPISLSLGVKSPAMVDPRKALAASMSYMTKSVSNGFAFKAVKKYNPPVILTKDGGELPNKRIEPDNTFITTHIFRHKDPRPMGKSMGATESLWNYTLGPDLAYNRDNIIGTAIDPPSGFVKEFRSAERFPLTQKDCVPRYSVECNEENSWNLNPCKVIAATVFEGNINTLSPGVAGYVPRAQPMYTFANTQPPPTLTDDPAQQQFGPQIFQSVPASQTCDQESLWLSVPAALQTLDPVLSNVPVGVPDGYYKVQSGKAALNYSFSNNGTCAVVVDVVVTKLQKGSEIFDTANFKNSGQGPLENERSAYSAGLFSQVSNGYLCAMKGATSATVVGGQGLHASDPISNMKHEFLPEKYFKRGISPSQATPGSSPASGSQPGGPTQSIPGAKYKFVARDQFIIAPGATKPWRTSLPGMDYDARKYRNFNPNNLPDRDGTLPTDNGPSDPFLNRVVYDDRCYAVSFRFSNVAVPIAEANSTDPTQVAIIERGATDINVSATGSYVETPRPCYKVKASKTLFNQGVVANPFYAPDAALPAVSVPKPIDIVNSAHAVRFATQDSAYMSVGATNSQYA